MSQSPSQFDVSSLNGAQQCDQTQPFTVKYLSRNKAESTELTPIQDVQVVLADLPES